MRSREERRQDKELEEYTKRLVDIDGEFCIPQEENEARHVLDFDFGPIFGEVRRPRSYFIKKGLLIIPAMFMFILAIQLMKAGADAIGPEVKGSVPFANPLSSMGTGWLGAYLVLSGSPVAATAISLFGSAQQPITALQTLTMLSGSRLGASFIVLVTGFLYAVRHKKQRSEGLGIGVQAMTMTAVTYVPGMIIAYGLLRSGVFDALNWHASDELDGVLSKAWKPIVNLVKDNLPGWAIFVVGIASILIAFKIIDLVLPHMDSDATASKRSSWLKHPWTMFLLGCIVATLTLSVSVALTVLVPLAVKGYVKRDEALPYIMGANITTLADTLVVAMLQDTPVAARIVLAEAIGVTIVSVIILAFVYGPVKRTVIGFDDFVVANNRRLVVFVGILFLIPLILLATGFFWSSQPG